MSDPGWDIPGVGRDASAGGVLTDGFPASGFPAAGFPASSPAASPDAAGGSAAGRGRAAARIARKASRARTHGSVSTVSGMSAGAFAPASASGSASAFSAAASSSAGEGSPADIPAPGSSAAGDDAVGDAVNPEEDTTAADGSPRAADALQALSFLRAGFEFLAHDDPAGWGEGVQADCLRALAVAEARQVAAHARVLTAFCVPGGGLNGDGHRSPRAWLSWQCRATKRAAAASVAWKRRLDAHPAIAAALADGLVSVSWARQLIEWTDRLPDDVRGDADGQLLASMSLGADLSDLAALAEELRCEHAAADPEDDGFEDRSLRLAKTFEDAGRLEGDLTARCAAAVQAVLDSLSGVRGPEDDRSLAQRQHDALEEACVRLIGAGMLPQRAGQPVHLELDITLQDLIGGDADGDTCDAVVQPVITGTVDRSLLEKLADPDSAETRALRDAAARAAAKAAAGQFGDALGLAVELLSGPKGYARYLRRGATWTPSAVSLPLEIPSSFDTIPLHLRRAVRRRDRHCRFPGCDQPAVVCDVHHITPRARGGPHALWNMILLCRFHHQIAIHRWAWTIQLHADGTTSAASPDRGKTLHSHRPRTMIA